MCCFMFTFVFHFLVLSYFSHFNDASCPPEFEDLCTCGYVTHGLDRKLTYVTNCTDAGFDHALMLRKMPPMTEVLVFVGNDIKDLPMNIFGLETAYEKLHTIDFSNNHIQTIKGRTFHNVGNVTKLILNDNDLYIVFKDHHPRMFSNFAKLRELHLRNAFTEKVKSGEYLGNLEQIFGNSSLKHLHILNMEDNEILEFDTSKLCFLPALEELYLANNHIKNLSLNFKCLRHLKVIDAGHNLISELTDATLQGLELKRYITVNLTSNPFKCDCNFVNTFVWMKTTSLNLVHRDYYYCYDGYPPFNIGQPVMSLAVDDLLCKKPEIENQYNNSTLIVLVIGIIFVTFIICGLLYKNWPMISIHTRRAIRPIQNKLNYFPLERRELSEEL